MCTPYFKRVYSSKNKPIGQTGEARNRPYSCGSQIKADTAAQGGKEKNPSQTEQENIPTSHHTKE